MNAFYDPQQTLVNPALNQEQLHPLSALEFKELLACRGPRPSLDEVIDHQASHLVVHEYLQCHDVFQTIQDNVRAEIFPEDPALIREWVERGFGRAIYHTREVCWPVIFARALTAVAAGYAGERIDGVNEPTKLAKVDQRFVVSKVLGMGLGTYGFRSSVWDLMSSMWQAAIHKAMNILRNPFVQARKEQIVSELYARARQDRASWSSELHEVFEGRYRPLAELLHRDALQSAPWAFQVDVFRWR